ncbi:MAG: DNA repair and recombination protein RadB [Thermoplasmata archaeon]|nr:DNA repair and recombination protein RadB [Thermoplasmata archaeon]
MVERLETGILSIDKMLKGGIEVGSITEIYGEPGTGKTNFVLYFSIYQARKGNKTVFLDTEKVSPERLYKMTNGDKELAKKIIFYNPKSFLDQEERLRNIYNLVSMDKEIKIIVIDSFTEYYGLELNKNDLIASLSKQLGLLEEMAKNNNMVVIITSRVYYSFRDDKMKDVGGFYINPAIKTIIRLEKKDDLRTAILEKHRSINVGKSANFIILDDGLREVE